MHSPRRLVLFVLVALIAGCDQGGFERPPPTTLRVLNVVPTEVGLNFVREERVETDSPLTFGAGASFTFDSDTYDFSVDSTVSGDSGTRRLATITRPINDQNEYSIVATVAAGEVEMLFIEKPLNAGSGIPLSIVHAAETQGSVDIYLEPPGTDPAAATPAGTLAFREHFFLDDRPADEYEFIVTAPGDAATVLFRSRSFSFLADTAVLIALADEGGLSSEPFGVYAAAATATRLEDPTAPSSIRIINAVNDNAARDFYLNNDFTTPLLAAAPAGSVSSFFPVPSGPIEIDATPAGNPSVEEGTLATSLFGGRRHSAVITGGSSGVVLMFGISEDLRSFSGIARVQFINAAQSFDLIDYYVLPPGEAIDFQPPVTSLNANGNTQVSIVPGDYELTLRDRSTRSVVAGPLPFTIAGNEVSGVLSIDAAGGSTVDLIFYDNQDP